MKRSETAMEDAYTVFAEVYDLFMDEIPYDKWCDYVAGLLHEHGTAGGVVAELGCGTGRMTRLLADKGYDMIGIDSSEDMLYVAKENSDDSILYLQQRMQDIELYGTVEAFVSVCDSMNYILTEEDFLCVLKKVNNYLEAGGIFVFDLKTEHYYRDVLGDRVLADNREEACYIWDNHYDEESGCNRYELTLFIQDEEDAQVFYREQELHIQRAYDPAVVERLIKDAGMEFVAAYDAFTKEKPGEASERIYIIAREGYQEGKYYEERLTIKSQEKAESQWQTNVNNHRYLTD